MADKVSIDIDILKGVFEELKALRGSWASIADQVKSLDDTVQKELTSISGNVHTVTDDVSKMGAGFEKTRAIDIAAIGESFRAIGDRLTEAVQPGIRFQTSMADLSAITGLVGKDLADVGGMARNLTKELGGEASDSVNAYKLLLSQLTPELAKNPPILNEMAKNAILLGKTMGGDTAGAVEVLTTVMNQFEVDLKNPIVASTEMSRIMNVMAAAAKEGSAELPALKAAMMEAGGTAKLAGVNYEETAAAIEVLDKAGKKGAEGGVALRNVMAILARGRFLPKDVQSELASAGVNVEALGDRTKSLKERLELLKPVAGDAALMSKLFGLENMQGANALVSMTDLLGEYTTKVTGTNTANEQAAVVMGTFAERMSRWKAQFADFGITLFDSTEKFLPFVTAGFEGVSMLGDLKNAQQGFALIMNSNVISSLRSAFVAMQGMSAAQVLQTGATGIATAAQWLWNAAMTANPIGIVIVAIGALVAGVVYAWNHFEGFRGAVMGTWEAMKVTFEWVVDFMQPVIQMVIGHFKAMGQVFVVVWDYLKVGVDEAGAVLNTFWGWISQFGGKVSSFFSGLVDKILAPFRLIGDLVSMIPGVDGLVEKYGALGTQVGEAYSKGQAEGVSDFRAAAIEVEGPKKSAASNAVGGAVTSNALDVASGSFGAESILGGKQPAKAGKAEPSGVEVAGKGGSGDRNISMNITLNMPFKVDRNVDQSLDAIIEKAIGKITNKFNDAAYAIG